MADYADADSARQGIGREPVDVLFVDVQMPGEDGLSLARSLCEQPQPPLFVFVTAHSRFAVDAFEVHALDYLLKPVHDDRLAQAIAKAEAFLRVHPRTAYLAAVRACAQDMDEGKEGRALQYLRRLNIRSIGRLEAVDIDDVRWIATAGNYVELHLGGRSLLHRVPISKLEARLDPADFLRVHRTAIVRRNLLRELQVLADSTYVARLQGGETVPVSAKYVASVRAELGRGVS